MIKTFSVSEPHNLSKSGAIFSPRVALASKRAVVVDALGVLVASSVVRQTLINVAAADTIASEALPAPALVGTLEPTNQQLPQLPTRTLPGC